MLWPGVTNLRLFQSILSLLVVVARTDRILVLPMIALVATIAVLPMTIVAIVVVPSFGAALAILVDLVLQFICRALD